MNMIINENYNSDKNSDMEAFLQELEKHLQSLKPGERQNALAYYREYLEEAGDEIGQALEHLGSPQSVAERILHEDAGEPDDLTSGVMPGISENPGNPGVRNRTGMETVLFGIGVILITSPFWLTAVLLWFAVVFALAIIVLTFVASTIVAPIQGIFYLTNHLLGDGLWNIGAGLLCAGITMLLWKPCVNGIVRASQFFWSRTGHLLLKLFRNET